MLDSSKPEAGEKVSETDGQGTGDVTLGCELGCESESIEHELGICGVKPKVCDATKCEAEDGSEVRCAFNRECGDKLDIVRWDTSKKIYIFCHFSVGLSEQACNVSDRMLETKHHQ